MRSTAGFHACGSGRTRALITCLIVFTAGRVWGQESGQLQFEAASVKLHTASSPSTGRSGVEETPGLIRVEDLSLNRVIGIANGVTNFQIEGPGWLDTVRVDITAKPPAGYEHGQLPSLLLNLLIDRFKLAVHHESKELRAFALVVAKGGSKLHEAMKPRDFFTGRPGLIEGVRVSTAELAGALARMLGSPVVDKTGLTAMYEMKLEWTPDDGSPAPNTDEPRDVSGSGTSLFSALYEQLGLRLQTQKLQADVVVIDHMERVPTEN
jgi:uncharacterized protein (TIGR03435 family)